MYTIIQGDCIEGMKTLSDESVHCVVTSPPYYGLRDYGVDGQIGLEDTPEAYVERLVNVFREVRRILRSDGTVWLNLGDSYAGSGKGPAGNLGAKHDERNMEHIHSKIIPSGLKPKDLIGIPWRVAFALQADGWWLRQDIIWHKPNPMPESVTDRCTKAHEYIFLLTKSERYYYDADAVKEKVENLGSPRRFRDAKSHSDSTMRNDNGRIYEPLEWRNKRSVWTVATKPYREAHFAVFPPTLIEPCILAGSPTNGVVFDPFTGSGTTAEVALKFGRSFIGTELNPEYVELIHKRLSRIPIAMELD